MAYPLSRSWAGPPKNLKELGAEKADPKELAKKAVEIPGKLGNFLPLYEKDIVKIYAFW